MHIFSISFFILLLFGCGKEETKNFKDPLEKIVNTTFSNRIILLQKQTSFCRSKKFNISPININLHLFIEGHAVTRPFSFSDLISGTNIVNSRTITEVTYGEEVEMTKYSGETKTSLISKPKKITICPEDIEYERKTVESAALNTSYYIKKTHDNFVKKTGFTKLPPINLKIGPKVIISNVEENLFGDLIKKSTYWTDNALYLPQMDTIVFLPSSPDFKNRSSDYDFWEIPMVASHEYGHHIFKHVYGKILHEQKTHHCFGTAGSKQKMIHTRASRYITINDVIAAINEGFADLIAAYSLTKREASVENVNCLDISRDVYSPVLINGRSKRLTEESVGDFFSMIKDYIYRGCQNPSYQEIHIFGAIVAHNIHSFFDSVNISNDLRLRILHNWIKAISTLHEVRETLRPRDYFEKILEYFFLEAQKLTNFNTNTCQIIRGIYFRVEPKICQSI